MQILDSTVFLTVLTSVTAITFTDVYNDLVKTNSDVITLTAKTNAYAGAPSQALALQTAFNVVLSDWTQVATDTNNAVPPSVSDATKVFNYVQLQLYNSVADHLKALDDKAALFKQYGILPQVCSSGRKLQTQISVALGNLVQKYPTQDLKDQGAYEQYKYYTNYENNLGSIGCPSP